MHRLILAFGLIAAGAWPSLQNEEITPVTPTPVIQQIEQIEPAEVDNIVFANYVSTEAPVDAPATTEDCVCENCNCENCECAKSGWQSTAPASSAGSYAGSGSAGSYAASSAGSYAGSGSAGSYGAKAPTSSAGSYASSHKVQEVHYTGPIRRVVAWRPFAGIRERAAARRAGRQSARHSRHSAHAAPSAGACSSCK